MSFIPVPDSASLCFDFGQAGQAWQFCFTVRKSAGGLDDADLITLATMGADWWTNHLDTNISGAATLNNVKVTDLTSEAGSVYELPVGTAGGAGAGFTPLGTALVASLRTNKRGRSYRGRVYIGGLPDVAISTAVDVTSAYAGYIAAAVNTLISELDAAGYDLVVASRQHNGVVTNPAETNEVTSVIVDTHFDSQRRRLAGRGQ